MLVYFNYILPAVWVSVFFFSSFWCLIVEFSGHTHFFFTLFALAHFSNTVKIGVSEHQKMMAHIWRYLDPLSPHQLKKNVSNLDPL